MLLLIWTCLFTSCKLILHCYFNFSSPELEHVSICFGYLDLLSYEFYEYTLLIFPLGDFLCLSSPTDFLKCLWISFMAKYNTSISNISLQSKHFTKWKPCNSHPGQETEHCTPSQTLCLPLPRHEVLLSPRNSQYFYFNGNYFTAFLYSFTNNVFSLNIIV